MTKYDVAAGESEILPNLLGLTDQEKIHYSEFEGFTYAEIVLTEDLSTDTRFDATYIRQIHRMALEHLYTFAGHYRTVNLSKGGFLFPAARFIPQSMADFEREILTQLPDRYDHKDQLIKDIAHVHSELLYIHPFREGNGRTARLLANLMARKQGYDGLHFEKIDCCIFPRYVQAVQEAAGKNYEPMRELIEIIFEA